MFLIDTNVVSETRKGANANRGVIAFWNSARAEDIYLSVQTIGELRRGVEIIRARGDVRQADLLAAWLELVVQRYADYVLEFDLECAQVWGRLMAPDPAHPIDKQIAAIALMHDLTIVTRNTADFSGSGARLLDPFTA